MLDKLPARLRLVLTGTVTLGLLVLVIHLVLLHVRTIVTVNQVSVPLVAQIPTLQNQQASLLEQVEVAELYQATRVGSVEEQMQAYVLPEELDTDRVLRFLTSVTDALKAEGRLSEVSSINLEKSGDEVIVQLSFKAQTQGLDQFFNAVALAGLITIDDALIKSDRQILFEQVDKDNPAGIVPLEQFLSTDLLRYGQDPRAYESRLTRSFSSAQFHTALHLVLQSNKLREARRALGGTIGRTLEQRDLWPVPFLKLRNSKLTAGGSDGWFQVEVELDVPVRQNP